jgi:hypothetical protein
LSLPGLDFPRYEPEIVGGWASPIVSAHRPSVAGVTGTGYTLRMDDAVVIVSLAPWARKGAWWRQANLALRSGCLERPATLLMRYFLAGGDCGALSLGEATLLRGWASTVAGWEERAGRAQFPLRFAGYSIAAPARRSL